MFQTMSERRFNEAEVAAIFERAAEAQQPGLRGSSSSADGMTLEKNLADLTRHADHFTRGGDLGTALLAVQDCWSGRRGDGVVEDRVGRA